MRKTISAKRRVELFRSHSGLCHICGGKIQAGEAWDVEHLIPIAMGGNDDETNWALAHRKCHKAKTSTDIGNLAKAKRREAKHMGARVSRAPLPGGKNTPWKRKINGTIVKREGVIK